MGQWRQRFEEGGAPRRRGSDAGHERWEQAVPGGGGGGRSDGARKRIGAVAATTNRRRSATGRARKEMTRTSDTGRRR